MTKERSDRRRSRRTARTLFALLLALATAPLLEASQAHASTNSCITDTYYSTPSKSRGFKGTSETSYQAAGPTTIHYTETSTASQTFSAGAAVSVEAGVIIAKAETTFSVNYSYTTSSSKAWGYDTAIPAGKTGLMAVLHSDDRVSTIKYVDQPNCTTTSTTFYSYLPRAATTNLDYCIFRDLYPYGYSSWRSSCVGE
ncbi:hypothetical protein GCM10027053_12220 [Intrasporangium mesophilum]